MRHPQTLKCVQIPSATDSLFFLAPNISNHTPKGSKPKQWNLLLVAAPTQAWEKGEKEYEGRQDKSRLSYLKTAQNSGEATELELPAYPSRQRSFIEPPAAVLCTVTHTHTRTRSLSLSQSLKIEGSDCNPNKPNSSKISLSPKVQQSDCNPDKPNWGKNQQSHKSTNFANWQRRILYENMRSYPMPYKLNPCALHIGR
jgi:hypothetical protein